MKLNGVKRLFKIAEKGINVWILLRQKKTQNLNTFPRQSNNWILPLLLKSVQQKMIMNELQNITRHIWKQRKKHNAKLLPQGSYEIELQLSIKSLSKLYNEALCYSLYTFPRAPSYKWFFNTINRLLYEKTNRPK